MSSTKTLLRVPVSESTVQTLEAQAAKRGKTVEEIVEERLFRFADVDSTKPLIISDQARQHLEKLLARNFSTPDELVSAIQRALLCRIDEVEIPCSPYLLERLRTRCIGMEFPKFMQATVKKLLEEYAGLR